MIPLKCFYYLHIAFPSFCKIFILHFLLLAIFSALYTHKLQAASQTLYRDIWINIILRFTQEKMLLLVAFNTHQHLLLLSLHILLFCLERININRCYFFVTFCINGFIITKTCKCLLPQMRSNIIFYHRITFIYCSDIAGIQISEQNSNKKLLFLAYDFYYLKE